MTGLLCHVSEIIQCCKVNIVHNLDLFQQKHTCGIKHWRHAIYFEYRTQRELTATQDRHSLKCRDCFK